MKRRAFVQGIAGALVGCAPRAVVAQPEPRQAAPAAPVGVPASEQYRLVKDWDFVHRITSRSQLRDEFHTRYIYAGGTLDHLNDEWTRYRDNNNHVFTPDGLALTARLLGPLEPGNIESGMLRSKWVGEYGVYEICMKVPKGAGMWPGFWLNPEDQRWPPEIDVVEIVNKSKAASRQSYHYLHGIDEKRGARRVSLLGREENYEPGFDYTDDFHVFAVEWSRGRVKHRVDGKLISDREFGWTHNDGTDGGAAHLLVQLAIGGKWPGPPRAEDLPARLVIRYMRVWQR